LDSDSNSSLVVARFRAPVRIRFYVSLDARSVVSETFFSADLSARAEEFLQRNIA